jgi:hypothetical protein
MGPLGAPRVRVPRLRSHDSHFHGNTNTSRVETKGEIFVTRAQVPSSPPGPGGAGLRATAGKFVRPVRASAPLDKGGHARGRPSCDPGMNSDPSCPQTPASRDALPCRLPTPPCFSVSVRRPTQRATRLKPLSVLALWILLDGLAISDTTLDDEIEVLRRLKLTGAVPNQVLISFCCPRS